MKKLLAGPRVTFPVLGRGRRYERTGSVVMAIPPHMTNKDALKMLRTQHRRLRLRKRDLRFEMGGDIGHRVFVLVEMEDGRLWLYAPSVEKVRPVEESAGEA